MAELKILPCPFCGGKAEMYNGVECSGHGAFYEYSVVMCSKCNASGKRIYDVDVKDKKTHAMEAWNRRVDNG